MNKKFLILVIIGLVAISGLYFVYNEYFNPEAKEEKEKIEMLKADTVGGKTPAETMQLFGQALKNGDVELAASYFTFESREQWRTSLQIIKENNVLEEMAKDFLEKSKPDPNSRQETGEFRFFIDNNGATVAVVVLKLNFYSMVWKISDL